MPSYRSATSARSCNRAVRVASGITHDAMPSDGSRERKCIGTPVEAVPKAEKTQRFWRNQIRLLTALIFLLSGLVAVAEEAFAGSKGCENIVADLNGKDVGFLTKTYPNSDFHATDQLHIDLIRNPSFWESAYFNAFAGSGTSYIEASYDGGVVTGNESASFSGQDLVLGGIYVEAINYSQMTSPWRMDVVCVTKSNPLDAALSGLALSSGNLEPVFNTNTMIYSATVANGVSTLAVTPSTAGTTAVVKINGVSAVSGASTAVPLNVGDNTLTITDMTEDRTVKRTYWVVVKRAAPPTITDVSPSIGSTAGGQSVTITGTNFIGVSAVAFGGVPASTFTVDSATRITATTPARTAGPADVTVTTVGNSSVTRANGYTYVGTPVVTAVKPLNTPARTYAIGAKLHFDVDFDQKIAVSNGGPQLKAVFGAVERRINLIGYVWNTMTFSYTVAENDLDDDGIAISSMSLEGATVKDYNHVADADITLRNIADTSGIRIDAVRPTVASIKPASTGTVFDVVFSEPVTAVDVGKFNLVKTGTAQGTIDSVSGSGSAYQVHLADVSGDGTLALSLSTGTGIKDSAGNEMTSGFTGGTPMIVAPPSSDASLSDIGVSSGTLAPAFDAATTSYTVSVGNSVSAITVTPANAHPSAVVSVNGTVITAPGSLPVNLQVGDNAISIVVTAQDAVTKKTYDIVVNRAGAVPDAPTAVSAASGDGEATVSFTAPVNTGTTPISSYTVTADPGGAATTGGSSPITVNGLANGTAYTFKVTATNSIGPGPASNASNSVTPKPAPIADAVTATVAANSSANPITLSLSGGAADAVAIGTQPTHGTVSVSGLAITYTPTPGYSGSDTFTYTATNATGTSAAATVAITVSAPTLTFSPPAGTLPGGTAATAYGGATVTAAAGTAPYTYAANGTLPDGLTLDQASGLISGTPTAAGDYTFTVTATDANNATGTAAYSIAIAVEAPTTGNVSATVAANSTANPVTPDLGGGIADTLTIGTQATHGTASVSGLAITYTPTPGYSGSDSFTYVATNAAGTSPAATVAITVTAPTLTFSPPAGALASGTAGSAYSGITVTASAGGAPYRYAITSGQLPAGLALDGATGAIGGTPTRAGNHDFTVTATDANNAAGTARYSIVVAAAPVDFTFEPPAGVLAEAMAGEDYSQPIAAKGGTGPMLYRLASGALPNGMVLNVSTGQLTGPLAADAGGSYSFTIEVCDTNGATGTASYTVKVQARTITVADKVVDVPAGSAPPDVYLNRGATGGPFTAAETIFVEPAQAGTASIIQGELAQVGPVAAPVGWYLKFTPNRAYSGQVRVGFRMVSALGTSNTGTVTYNLAFDASGHAAEIDALVRDFVRTRQNLIASTIKVPGLLDRRRMAVGTDTVTTRMTPSTDGVTLGFSTSLAQMEAARDRADGVDQAEASPFNIWLDSTFLMHRRKDDDDRWGNFGMVSLGADYLLSEKALLGVSFHYDRMTDPTDEDAELFGDGWLAGPYASFELGKGIFWDSSLLYGGSSNTIDTTALDGTFDTRRFLLDTAVKGQWQLDDATVFTPALRAVYFSETVDDYGVRNGTGDEIDLKGFTEEQLRVSLGAEIARPFTLDNDRILTPKLGGTLGYSGLDGAGLFGSFSAALSLQTGESWSIDTGLLFNIEGDGETSAGAKVGVRGRF